MTTIILCQENHIEQVELFLSFIPRVGEYVRLHSSPNSYHIVPIKRIEHDFELNKIFIIV
jgi:hypothetical protein